MAMHIMILHARRYCGHDSCSAMTHTHLCGEVALIIGPQSGSQLGGTAIYVSGPCFSDADAILCFFGESRNRGTGLPGFYVSNTTAVCVSPVFDTPGWIDLSVGVRIGQRIHYSSTSRFYAGMSNAIAESLQHLKHFLYPFMMNRCETLQYSLNHLT